jgi:CheY-specific phosphatase CheX
MHVVIKKKELNIGQALVELKYLDEKVLPEFIKIQDWLNSILTNISYESSFVEVIKGVLKDSFKCIVETGTVKKVSFPKPLKDIVYIQYSVSGKFNGRVFYISDRSFMQNLAKTMMASVGRTETDEFDESYVSAVSSVIITNSLSKLSQMGLFSSSEIPKILMEKQVSMDKEVIIADNKTISLVPLINQWGRFAIGLEIT